MAHEVKMDVKLIGKTTCNYQYIKGVTPDYNYLAKNNKYDSCAIINGAAKQCYNKDWLFNQNPTQYEDCAKFIRQIAESGHTSILEHASATFQITGVSRALSHQLVRHRIASYTQQSQRYVNFEDFGYIVPSFIKTRSRDIIDSFKQSMQNANDEYIFLLNDLLKSGASEQKAIENARSLLPNACSTNIVMTMNYRELGAFLGTRMCNRAQDEIRELARTIFKIMSKEEPIIFGLSGVYKGAKCENNGFCSESKSCGKYSTKKDFLYTYYNTPDEHVKRQIKNLAEPKICFFQKIKNMFKLKKK